MKLDVVSKFMVDDTVDSDAEFSDNPYTIAMSLVDLSTDGARGYSGYLRASQIGSLCPREEYLGYKHNLRRYDIAGSDPAMKVTFDIGHAVHSFIQNNQRYFGSRRVGWWKCLACGYRWFGRYQRVRCEKCGASPNAFVYDELEIKIEHPYRLWGHIDMLIVFGGDVRVLDIKTIDKDIFADLERPLYDNIMQLICYMNYVNYSDIPIRIADDYGIILYVSKGYSKDGFPMKAFIVENDLYRRREIERKLDIFTRAIDLDVLPKPLAECSSTDFKHSKARMCPAREVCRRLHNQ